jgi:hypothetical protein
MHALSLDFISLVLLLVLNNSADYDGGIVADSDHGGNYSVVKLVNSSANSAVKWTSEPRLNHAGGLMPSSWFDGAGAAVCGGSFNFTWSPTNRCTRF